MLVWQVTMADRSAAERACKDPNPIIDGRKANVNLAYLGAKPRILPGRTLSGYGEYDSKTYSRGHRRRLFILGTGANYHWGPGFLGVRSVISSSSGLPGEAPTACEFPEFLTYCSFRMAFGEI